MVFDLDYMIEWYILTDPYEELVGKELTIYEQEKRINKSTRSIRKAESKKIPMFETKRNN